jgi:hypothetical protein
MLSVEEIGSGAVEKEGETGVELARKSKKKRGYRSKRGG